MLQTLRHYVPATTSAISSWWYGDRNEDQMNDDSPQNTDQTSLLPCVPEESSESEAVKDDVITESQFIDTLKIPETEKVGLSSDDEYRTGSEYALSSRRNTTEGTNFDLINQFPLSSDDEYKTCNEQHNGLINSQHKLDDRFRQIILEGLSETNDEEDELPSRRRYTRSYLHSIPKDSNESKTLLSHSAPAGDGRNRVYVRNMDHIYEHTDSDSSCFDTNNEKRKQNKKTSLPFSLFHSKKGKNTRRRRTHSATQTTVNRENELILRVKPKSYGSDEKTLIMNSNENQIRSLHNKHLRDVEFASNDESDYPVISLSPEQQSASYFSTYNPNRQSLSESSCQQSVCSLDSSWSEYTISLPSPDEAYECRESDLESTREMLSSNSKAERKAKRPQYLVGGLVKESFLDNECFCCQCSLM